MGWGGAQGRRIHTRQKTEPSQTASMGTLLESTLTSSAANFNTAVKGVLSGTLRLQQTKMKLKNFNIDFIANEGNCLWSFKVGCFRGSIVCTGAENKTPEKQSPDKEPTLCVKADNGQAQSSASSLSFYLCVFKVHCILCMCLGLCMYIYVQVPTEAKQGHCILWN